MTMKRMAPETATTRIHRKRAMLMGFRIHCFPMVARDVQSIFRWRTPLIRSRMLEVLTERETSSLCSASFMSLAEGEGRTEEDQALGLLPSEEMRVLREEDDETSRGQRWLLFLDGSWISGLELDPMLFGSQRWKLELKG